MSNYTSLSPELLQQYPNIPYNFTDCTLKTCPLELANLDYDPSLGGNLVFLIIFSVLLVVQLGLGIAYRTWGFMVATAMGLVLEVIGYVARVQMHYNPFTANPFLMYVNSHGPFPIGKQLIRRMQVYHLPNHRTRVLERSYLHLPRPHHRHLRRGHRSLHYQGIHRHLHVLRFLLPDTPSCRRCHYRYGGFGIAVSTNWYQYYDCWVRMTACNPNICARDDRLNI